MPITANTRAAPATPNPIMAPGPSDEDDEGDSAFVSVASGEPCESGAGSAGAWGLPSFAPVAGALALGAGGEGACCAVETLAVDVGAGAAGGEGAGAAGGGLGGLAGGGGGGGGVAGGGGGGLYSVSSFPQRGDARGARAVVAVAQALDLVQRAAGMPETAPV
jgi:hypothetical protein